jgi:hypothetical protein
VSGREVCNRHILSLSSHQSLGKHNLKVISELLGIAFNLGLFGDLEIWWE